MFTIDDVVIFADGLDHAECVAVHPDGSVWAGGEGGQIYRIAADGESREEVCNTGGFVLGIAFSPDVSWLAICDLKQHCIWKFHIDTRELVLFACSVEGNPIAIPNFPVFDDAGNLYISESGAFRTVTGCIYRFDNLGNGTLWHPGPFSFANGMALSADRKGLYVVCTWLPGVERVGINNDGTAGGRTIVATFPQTCPDGVALDSEGSLYISFYAPNRICKVNGSGEITVLIDDWESHTICNPTNMAFGGNNFNELFIANLGRWHISKINVGIKGLKLPCYK